MPIVSSPRTLSTTGCGANFIIRRPQIASHHMCPFYFGTSLQTCFPLMDCRGHTPVLASAYGLPDGTYLLHL